MNILVVDDDEDSTVLLTLALEREGWRVDTAGTLFDARRAISANPYDVIVTDLNLPDGSGRLLMSTEMRPTALSAAILVTGANDELRRTQNQADGFDRCLSKPIDANEMVATIRRLTA